MSLYPSYHQMKFEKKSRLIYQEKPRESDSSIIVPEGAKDDFDIRKEIAEPYLAMSDLAN